MKSTIALATVIAFGFTAVNAGEMKFGDLDTDGSGGLSLFEVQTGAPQVTAEDFAAYDADSSGELSEDEFNSWIAAASEDPAS
ncbi:MAG: hypothetical protein AAGJ87_00405 [Pseudomonadota bacterium]